MSCFKIYFSFYRIALQIIMLFASLVSVTQAQPPVTFKTKELQSLPGGIIAGGATPRLISNQFIFTEGPASDKVGNVYFTDQPNNKIWKYDINGKLSVFLENAGRSNGLYFDERGNLLSCADEHNQLWSISPSGKVRVLVEDVNGLHLNGPNDLWISPSGNIYFTDPYYQRDYWTRKTPEIERQKVYLLQKNKPAIMVIDTLVQPNGIIGTPDGRYLYVADIGANRTYKYTIAPDGSLQKPTLFASMGSDGMTIDNKGNVYLTGKGVTVFNKEGEQIEHISIPADWTANVTFGGKKRNQLFITASKSVYVLDMKVKAASH